MFYIIILLVILLDQASKWIVMTALPYGQSMPVIDDFFYLTLIRNKGVAFGFFADRPDFLFFLITASLVVLFVWSRSLIKASKTSTWALGLILGGAFGNWIDRLRFGSVVDFLDFRVWPIFNLADSCITVGVALYLIFLMKGKKTPAYRQAGKKGEK